MTFSNQVKDEILNFDNKIKKCCAFSFLYGFMFAASFVDNYIQQSFTFVKNAENLGNICNQLFWKSPELFQINNKRIVLKSDVIRYSTIAEIENNVFKCPHCHEFYLKGLFSSRGMVCDPTKSYQLELILMSFEQADEIKQYLLELGLNPHMSKRGKQYVVYFKRNEDIEDFLIHIGAKNSAFIVMNSKINKEIRNTANRITNCDSANINKSIVASQKYVDAIKGIIEKNMLECLPKHLQETAKLRLEHIDLNFSDLGLQFTPAISKSGVYHRLEKILEFYKSLE
ncbi:MAG: DNA-binding protein WhiA [Clostridia bacterium]|nr:DNA-binding protein WhiA [Clostridia bacterium]